MLLVLGGGLGLAAGIWFGLLPLVTSDEDASDPRTNAAAYLAAWEGEEWGRMRTLVTAPPQGFERVHAETWERLSVERAELVLTGLEVEGDSARARVGVALRLAGLGEWRYRTTLLLVREGEGWLVDWRPAAIHPRLAAGLRLVLRVSWPERAPILAHDGTPLVTERPVIAVGVEPRRIENRRRMLRALERLVGADPERVAADLDAPGVQPDWFVPVTELRPARYRAVRPELYPVPGVVFREATARLAPSDGFADHVLGQTGEATAELLDELGPPYDVGDRVGLFGLERVLERELAGSPSARIELLDAADERLAVLARFEGAEPRPVRTTLDRRVQAAAEAALDRVRRPAALVALDAETGAIRAAASRPLAEFGRALAGRYPPGSTFKIVTAAALLAGGRSPADTVECPPETILGGRRFRNAEGTPTGPMALASAFAVSCNTAFATLGAGLPARALRAAAETFGFGAPYELPLDAAGGSFPDPADAAEQAAAAIGQGRVEASPLHMATVAAAVASGAWRAPALLAGDEPLEGRRLPPAVARTLRELMRLVVTDGTGQAADVEGAAVAGKTGSAEFGADDPPETHAWFVGFSDGLAFAVLVEGGGGGGRVAAPIAARFLGALR